MRAGEIAVIVGPSGSGKSTFLRALAAGAFYAMAGIKHVASGSRSFEANTAMVSDLWMAAILLGFAGYAIARG